MNIRMKTALLGGVMAGIISSIILAGIDYFTQESFRILHYVFYALFMMIFMSFWFYYSLKKTEEKQIE